MLFSLLSPLIPVACAVASSTPQLRSSGGLEKRDDYVCSHDACLSTCVDVTYPVPNPEPIELEHCSYITNLINTNGLNVTVHPNGGTWKYSWNSCVLSITNRLNTTLNVCPGLFPEFNNDVSECNGDAYVCEDHEFNWGIEFLNKVFK